MTIEDTAIRIMTIENTVTATRITTTEDTFTRIATIGNTVTAPRATRRTTSTNTCTLTWTKSRQ